MPCRHFYSISIRDVVYILFFFIPSHKSYSNLLTKRNYNFFNSLVIFAENVFVFHLFHTSWSIKLPTVVRSFKSLFRHLFFLLLCPSSFPLVRITKPCRRLSVGSWRAHWRSVIRHHMYIFGPFSVCRMCHQHCRRRASLLLRPSPSLKNDQENLFIDVIR